MPLYIQLPSEKKEPELRARAWEPQLSCRFVKHSDPMISQDFRGLSLSPFPCWNCPRQQLSALRGQVEWLLTRVFCGHGLEPTLGPHPLDVAAKRGRVQLEDFTDLYWLSQAELRGYDQEVQLADLKAEGPQGFVIQVSNDAIQ